MVSRRPSPSWIGILDRKILRDFLAIRIQALAISLVIAGGVSVQLLSSGMVTSLEDTRAAYYNESLMADAWAPVVRAPRDIVTGLQRIDGVQAVEGRLRFGVRIEIPSVPDPMLGEVISVPELHEPSVNRLHLASGRLPQLGRRDEVVVLKRFAQANRIAPGDQISMIVRGRQVDVTITGLVMSPEHVYAIAPGDLVPDERRFGVLWMNEQPLSELAGWEGALNEVVLRLSQDANVTDVLGRLDSQLADYGAVGAYARDDQISDAFVSSEVDQLRTLARVVPPVFLGVASVLVYIVVSRLVAVQRSAIGLLKAYGYSTPEVILHFLKLVALIGAAGILIGVLLGIWFGRSMAELYIRYYDFPFLLFRAALSDYFLVCASSAVAVLGGGVFAVRASTNLTPAEAMTAPPPPDYSRAAGSAVTRLRWIDHQTRMILRQIIRWPGRAMVTIGGIAASLALLLSVLVMMDGMDGMVSSYFGRANRYDLAVTFVEARGLTALHDLQRHPSVQAAEAFRVVAARIHSGTASERIALIGAPDANELSRLIDATGRWVPPPLSGLVLSDDLARKMNAVPGDQIELEVTSGKRQRTHVQFVAQARTYLGSAALMSITDLNRILGEGDVISGAYLTVDPAGEAELEAMLMAAPHVASVSSLNRAEDRMRALMDENIGTSLTVFALFAGMIALGVVYNSVRISFSERQRELASLRVLGFSKGDVSYILLGEVALLALIAIPVGLASGCLLSLYFSQAMGSDLFRLPLVFKPSTMVLASMIVIGTTALSGLLVRQRIDSLDLVEVLKSS